MNSVKDVPGLVWRLQGSIVRDVECWVSDTSSGLFVLRVTYNRETMLEEMYADASTAMARANRLRVDLAKTGWSVTRE
jgi:hypothetical protein